MIGHEGLTRRKFLQTSGMASIGVHMQGLCPALEIQPRSSVSSHLVFVGVVNKTSAIHVYQSDDERWLLTQVIDCDAPIAIALHPNGRSLYALQELQEWNGLPRGSVEAFTLEARTGKLTSVGRQGLSLSAIMPRDLAVSADGTRVAVAVHGGGAYNVFPIEEDGRLGLMTGIRKEAGCGPLLPHQARAHPQAVVFDRRGRIIASDMGCDRLSLFSCGEDGLEILSRHDMLPGSGPQDIALHPSENLLYVANALHGSITGLRYDARAGSITEQLVQVNNSYHEAMTMHPSGKFLFASKDSSITSWRIDVATGLLDEAQRSPRKIDTVLKMSVLADGRALIAVSSKGLLKMEIEASTGRLKDPVCIAQIDSSRCIAVSQAAGRAL